MRSADKAASERTKHRGRRIWALATVLVLGWLALGAFSGPFLGKLSDVQSHDPSAFLPANAESTAVTQLRDDFTDTSMMPTVVVFERDSGLTRADKAAIADVAAELGTLEVTVGDIPPATFSQDGEAARILVPTSDEDPFRTARGVREMQDIVAGGMPDGLRALVTGPGGYTAASAEVFGGVDGMLLLVTAIVVAVILIVVYRSPLLPIIVLASAALALCTASAVIYAFASNDVLTLNGQTQGILMILVFGAATDYALLLVARYREELRGRSDAIPAMRATLRSSWAPILASGGTVIVSMLCMLVSELASNKSLGPIVSIGIAGALLSSLTFLPAVLALTGRVAFWPMKPTAVKHREDKRTLLGRVAHMIAARPRRTWVVTALILLAGAAFVPTFDSGGTSKQDLFLTDVEATAGSRVLAEHFPASTANPVIIMTDADTVSRVREVTAATEGVVSAAVLPADPANPEAGPKTVHGVAQVTAILKAQADSQAAMDVVTELRHRLDTVPAADAKVGGSTAQRIDMLNAAEHDRNAVIPLVLVVIFLLLAALLRSVFAPLLLIGTVVLSFAATLGVGALVFEYVFGFPGADPSLPLYAFVFLVALGIDYNIFLMTRAREETPGLGTANGTLRALRVTGGVITSAGVVLAATFAALSVLPVLFLVQLAFLVAFGVLLDTFIVRTILVPALVVDIGRFIWWPGKLGNPARQHLEPDKTPV